MSDSVTVNQYRFLRNSVGRYLRQVPIFESRKISIDIRNLWKVIIRNIRALWPYTGPQGKIFREGVRASAGDEEFLISFDYYNVVGPALLEGPQKWPYYDRVKTAVLLDEELENDTEREITYARVLMEVAINCKNHGKGTIDETILNDVLDQAKQYYNHIIYVSKKAPSDSGPSYVGVANMNWREQVALAAARGDVLPAAPVAPNLTANQLRMAKAKYNAHVKKLADRERAEREAEREAERAWREARGLGGGTRKRRAKKTRRHRAKVLSRKE